MKNGKQEIFFSFFFNATSNFTNQIINRNVFKCFSKLRHKFEILDFFKIVVKVLLMPLNVLDLLEKNYPYRPLIYWIKSGEKVFPEQYFCPSEGL